MTCINFLNNSLIILSNTPDVLNNQLFNSGDDLLNFIEGSNTWTVKQVVGHLLDADRTNWMFRLKAFNNKNEKYIVGFDRFAHLTRYGNYSLERLLKEERIKNVSKIKQLDLSKENLQLIRVHPLLGEVSLHNIKSTCDVHDLSHINQICRVMSRIYLQEVGVWSSYFSVLKYNQNK